MSNNDIREAMQKEIGVPFTCTEHGDYQRIRTPYLYPDGDIIDVFCKSDGDVVTVTDLAETTGWIRMQSMSLRRSPKQNQLIGDVCLTHGVEFYRGMLPTWGLAGRGGYSRGASGVTGIRPVVHVPNTGGRSNYR